MTTPHLPLGELKKLDGDDLVRELWFLFDAFKLKHQRVMREGGQVDLDRTRRGAIDFDEVFPSIYGKPFKDIYDDGTDFFDRIHDALATLCERGFVWFKKYGTPWAAGQPREATGRYELTPKGRVATVEDVTSGWPSDRGLLDRFPQHATWDETMGAYFRMAVRTYEAGIHEAATFLLGGAAERLLDLVEERVENLLPQNREKRRNRAGERLSGLVELFKRRGDNSTAELMDCIGNMARWNRNEVGHPGPAAPKVDPSTVLAMLCNFRDYVSRVLDAADALVASP